MPLVGICAGGIGQPISLPRPDHHIDLLRHRVVLVAARRGIGTGYALVVQAGVRHDGPRG
jgi:hypothetical protein